MNNPVVNIRIEILTILITLILSSLPALVLGQRPDIDKLDDAVVLVLIYDHQKNYVGHGSGFFIDGQGTVLTNYHVIQGAHYLKIRTNINDVVKDYDVDKVLRGDKQIDLVLLSVRKPSQTTFPYLTLAKSYPSKGEDCWAIGTPANPKYMNTVSKGP